MNIRVKDENAIKTVLKHFLEAYKTTEDLSRYTLVDCVYRLHMVVGSRYNRVVGCQVKLIARLHAMLIMTPIDGQGGQS